MKSLNGSNIVTESCNGKGELFVVLIPLISDRTGIMLNSTTLQACPLHFVLVIVSAVQTQLSIGFGRPLVRYQSVYCRAVQLQKKVSREDEVMSIY